MKIRYIMLLVLVLAVGISGLMGDSSKAADNIYIVDQYGNTLNPASIVEMRTSSLQLSMETDGTTYDDERYRVTWSIEDPAQRDVIARLVPGSAKNLCIVQALSPGDVTITVTVSDAMNDYAVLGSTTCNIRVLFSIDTSKDDSVYKKVNESDSTNSLVLYADDAPVDLTLNFGEASKTQWMSANDEVVEVDQRSGRVTPVGAGKTQITATYTPGTTGGTETYTAYLDVYVIPKASKTNGGPYLKSQDVVMESGGTLYTDTDFHNNLEVVRSKIVWVVKQDDGNGNSVVIADSLGKTSDLITITPTGSRSNELRIEGVAGQYDIYFYTFGSYFSEDECTSAYQPTIVRLTLRSTIEDREEVLHIGDMYDFAKAYNMTPEDFNKAFTVNLTTENGGSYGNYVSWNSSTAILTANAEGIIKATITVKSGQENYVKSLMGLDQDDPLPGPFTTRLNIVDRVYLDRSNLTISVGQEYQLNLVLNTTYTGSVTWTSSDARYVSVDEGGLIKGLQITGDDVVITATVDVGDGRLITATCIVKVEAQINGFTLSPDGEQTMLVGEHITVVANIKQTVSVAPLIWTCSDANNPVFSVAPAADGKSVVVTALRTGTADLMVRNSVTGEEHSIRITVRSAIQTISFAHSELSVEFYKEGYNMKKEVKYTPTNATDTALTWVSSDTSVLTVDPDGYMDFKGPGTTLVTVYPTYNPYNVMASCLVTIIANADGLSLETTDIIMNVGETRTVPVKYLLNGKETDNAAADLTWAPTPEGIATVSWDEKVKLATITAKAPGETNINITSPQTGVSTMHVTVKQPSTKITVAKEMIILTGDINSKTLEVTLTPANSTDTLTFSSYNTSIATVDAKGRVTGVKAGDTFIEIRAYNGSASGPVEVVHVTVRDGVKGVALDSYTRTIYVGDSVTIAPIFNPTTAYNKEMKWTSMDTKIAKVEAAGTSVSNVKVTGVAAGTTMVTGVTTDGGYTVSCMIIVKNKPTVNDTKVTVSPTTKYLKKGKSFYVQATVTGSSNKKVKWSTSKKKVATVSSSGKVKGKQIGTAYITATARDGSGAYARCKVIVVRRVTKLTLNKYSATLLVGSTLKLKAKVRPKNATVKTVKWTTSDKTVATVSGGRVLGLAEGMVRIQARTIDGSNKKATCIVRVKEPVDATGVDVANSEITVAKGKAIQSGIKVSPANATTKIKYHSDNKKVATVDKYGKIRTKRAGQATIYGRTANGKIGYCDVLVVDLNRKGLVMRQYDTEQLSVNLIDEGVTWYSKNINIATVSPSGLVTGRRKGTTIIYANVNGVKLGCRVRIKKIK
ncbi:MAG: Ig domain-containing protein [Lachnospiraceae bacterium]|nr:Ig domain-containing protein [Lachnospiraceae bacterium]